MRTQATEFESSVSVDEIQVLCDFSLTRYQGESSDNHHLVLHGRGGSRQRQFAIPTCRRVGGYFPGFDNVIRLLDSGTNSLDSAPEMRPTAASNLWLWIGESTEEGRRR